VLLSALSKRIRRELGIKLKVNLRIERTDEKTDIEEYSCKER
jgi:hypothetical protein